MAKIRNPKLHDGSYRRLFSHPQMIEALLRRYVAQPWVERLDFSTLEQVPRTTSARSTSSAKATSSGG